MESGSMTVGPLNVQMDTKDVGGYHTDGRRTRSESRRAGAGQEGGGSENRAEPPRTKTEPNCAAYSQGRVVVAVPILSVMARALGWRRM